MVLTAPLKKIWAIYFMLSHSATAYHPQGTVLGLLLFLLHINDLPSCVNSEVRLFEDDCLIYR